MIMPIDRYIKVGTLNTRYWAEGSQGQPVILIHGIGGYVETWLPCLNALASKHRVFALDLPGHGRTDKPANISYKIADLTRFVKDFMYTLQIERAHVVGHSLGGAVSTRLTLMFPTVIDKIVLVDAAGLGKEGAVFLKIASLPILGEILTRPSRSGSAKFTKLVVHDPTVMTAEDIELNYQISSQPGAHRSFLKTLRANANLLGQHPSMYGPNVSGLASITNPILVVWGRQDQVIPVAHAEVAAKGFPNVQVHILNNCGHLPMLEHTQAFNELLMGFFNQ